MDLVQLDIKAIRQSDSQNNAYVLLLNETVGNRQLPIVIGWCEARSIAIALDGTEEPGRPLTHDLFKTFGDNYDITIQKVIIHTLIEGIFHASFHCKHKVSGEESAIDARTSDAIALAIRYACPIFTYEDILARAGIIVNSTKEEEDLLLEEEEDKLAEDDGITSYSIEKLERLTIDRSENPTKKAKIIDHKFQPVRFVIAHSDVDKQVILKRIEKFNDSNNAEGHSFMILVGSKILRESYDIHCIQNTFIMGRPDNIATLIQILGRAVRKFSHRDLPENKRHVSIFIYTSCLPIKDSSLGDYAMSYEESKYKLKISDYKIIQQIERIFHENAIDAVINENIIAPDGKFTNQATSPYEFPTMSQKISKTKCSYELDVLPFKPVLYKKLGKQRINKVYKLQDLQLSTFDVYHNKREIDMIILIIKRLFIEVSHVWEFETLWATVKKYPYNLAINTKLFDISNFIIALHTIVGIDTDNECTQYTQPYIDSKESRLKHRTSKYHLQTMIDRIFDSTHTRMIHSNGQESVIKQFDKYYIMFPTNIKTQHPIIDIELPYRGVIQKPERKISVKHFLENEKNEIGYTTKKQRFYNKYRDVELKDMGDAICECSGDFHIQLIEDSIECIFASWVFPNQKLSSMHNFYFKMIYYYDAMNALIWCSTAKEYIVELYKKYMLPIALKTGKKSSRDEDINRSTMLNLLQSQIDKVTCIDCTQDIVEKHEDAYSHNAKKLQTSSKTKKSSDAKGSSVEIIVPTAANVLPIGHFFKYIPRFYHPIRGWFSAPEYIESIEWVENDIIIGYDEKLKTALKTRFKIRSPMHKIKKFKDIRMIEKGSICASKNKKYLLNLCRLLNIEIVQKRNVTILCDKIKADLLRREMNERRNLKSNIKYYYLYFEKQIVLNK